jgi:hypothetical protein
MAELISYFRVFCEMLKGETARVAKFNKIIARATPAGPAPRANSERVKCSQI